jgi:hypothetical protein
VTPPVAKVISGPEALAEFRQGLSGEYALDVLAGAPWGVLVQLAVGVGKSEWLVKIIAHALESEAYDLVVGLVPRWDILRELLKRLPRKPKPVVLTPRPRSRCGDLDATWVQYERQGLGYLGRATLCAGCPRRQRCSWPGQYGRRLREAKLILGTQQHLVLNPQFIVHLQQQARALRPLVLLDESNLVLTNAERAITKEDLARFIATQEARLGRRIAPKATDRDWLEHTRVLEAATTADLRGPGWRFPALRRDWATEVQQEGLALFGQHFRFLGYDLHHLARADPTGRERLPGGDIRFTAPPHLGDKFLIFSGSIAKELARYRLDPNHDRAALVVPFEGYRFEHPQTRWYNVASLLGSAKFFPGNAPQILDFFAGKVARNIEQGKRTLLVSRKKFIPLCVRLLRERLGALGVGPVKFATGDWGRQTFEDPRTIAVINYGVSGLNRFEHFDAAYCLNAYYVPARTVSEAVQEVEATNERYPLTLQSGGKPRRRTARVAMPDGRASLLPFVAQQALVQKEADVVVQAVGRVRPFTRPREAITFQADVLPGVRYTMEFDNLEQARSHFQIATPARVGLAARIEQARRLRAQGLSQARIAAEIGVSLPTVKRYLRQAGGSSGLPPV